MTEPRLSTVFDYSDLRLHPDGTRVYQKASNRRPVLAKVTVQDARANWIAKDAGGSARIAKYRKRAPKNAAEEDVYAEEIDLSRELDDEAGREKRQDEEGVVQSGEEGSDTSQRRKKRAAKKPPDQRQFKRRKFEASYEYLEPHEPRAKSTDTAAISEVPAISDTFPTEPSPDLLKVIHRFASEFYTERGQLLNISREYRKERKKRALERKAKSSDGGSSRASKKKAPLSRSQSLSSSSDFDGDFSVQNSDDLSEDEAERRRKLKGKGKARERDSETRGVSADRDQDGGEDEDHGERDEEARDDETDEIESDSDADTKKSTKRKRRKKPGRERILPALYTDMYKVFDGSAMMALGMLVQEHIASLLNPEVPENWIKEVKSVYTEDASSGDGEDGDEQLRPEGGDIGDGDEQEEDEEDGGSEAAEDDEKDEEHEKGQEEDEMDEEDDLSDEEGDDEWDEGADRGSIPKDDKLEHRNENEHRINPYLPASSRTQTQSNIIHVDSGLSTSGERTTGFGLEDDDDPIECTSDESSRSEDTVHSDAEDEFV